MSYFFFFKQKTAYEMRISDWSSDVCSSDLFACEVTRPDDTVTVHQMSSVTPMPNAGSELPEDGKPIPADTWVELTFADADGNEQIGRASCRERVCQYV